jgi:heavy metal translocating P-type ATPase
MFYLGRRFVAALWRAVRYRVITMDTLVGMGTLAAYVYSSAILFVELLGTFLVHNAQLFFETTIIVIGFVLIGDYLVARSRSYTKRTLEKLLSLQVKHVKVIRDGREYETPVTNLIKGDLFRVLPGEKVATDGIVREGSSALDESVITGESLPVDKKPGDVVVGGTLNTSGVLLVEATKVGADTMLSQIIEFVRLAQNSPAPVQRLADRIVQYFVPAVSVLAFVSFFVWMVVGNASLALVSFISVLVIACPCAMGLATPIAVTMGMGLSAQSGILIRDASTIERLQKIKTVVFDKTGTITYGKPVVTGYAGDRELIPIAHALENHSTHPLARAILAYEKSEKSLPQVKTFKNMEGIGVEGEINGTVYFIISLHHAKEEKKSIPSDIETITDQWAAQGSSIVCVGTAQTVRAAFAITDTIRPEAKTVVDSLHARGYRTVLVTGDHRQAAHEIARQAGINTVFAQVKPIEKANIIKKIRHDTRQGVIMIGDGVNDAPALSTADIGISFNHGTDVAIESADIVLVGGGLRKIEKAFFIASATLRTIRQNLAWAFGFNVVALPVAAGALYPIWGIVLNPAIDGAVMAFSSVAVVFNALRLRYLRI